MNEFQAALGLLQLKHVDAALRRREALDNLYRNSLAGIRGIDVFRPATATRPNHSYMPILVRPDYVCSRDELYERLKSIGVFARRYFYPLISSMPMYRALDSAREANLMQASLMARQIICLPIFPDLDDSDVVRIAEAIRST